jgi:hypothetical protein
MTLEEAMAISEHRLPGEPPEADWRASRPRPEPRREERKLDTMPAAPEIDSALVIRQAILAERSVMSEVIGEAIGEVNNQTLDEVEQLIAQAAGQIKTELREEIGQMREEFFKRLDLVRGQGAELKTELDKIVARRKRARAAKPEGSPLMLPAPLADAPGLNGNGDGRG